MWCRSVLTLGHGVVVGVAAVDHPGMTAGLVGDVGGLSTRAPPKCLSKPMPSESNAQPMAQQSLGFRGRDTTSVIPATSTQWQLGFLCGHRKVRPVNSFGWRGGPSGRSSLIVIALTAASDSPTKSSKTPIRESDRRDRVHVASATRYFSYPSNFPVRYPVSRMTEAREQV